MARERMSDTRVIVTGSDVDECAVVSNVCYEALSRFGYEKVKLTDENGKKLKYEDPESLYDVLTRTRPHLLKRRLEVVNSGAKEPYDPEKMKRNIDVGMARTHSAMLNIRDKKLRDAGVIEGEVV